MSEERSQVRARMLARCLKALREEFSLVQIVCATDDGETWNIGHGVPSCLKALMIDVCEDIELEMSKMKQSEINDDDDDDDFEVETVSA